MTTGHYDLALGTGITYQSQSWLGSGPAWVVGPRPGYGSVWTYVIILQTLEIHTNIHIT